MDYNFKRVTRENLVDIQYLIKEVYGVNRDLAIIDQKYDTTYFGKYTIGLIAYSKTDNLPAAYYGVFPCLFNYKNKTILVAQSGDTMTHPNHRKKGLFVTLAKKTYEIAKSEGVAFVFGFPVEASYYGFIKKLDWQHKKDIKKYSFITPFLPYSIIQKVIPFNTYLRISSFILKPFKVEESFPYSNKDSNSPHLLRNNAYYQYKQKPANFNIKFLGLNVWFQINGITLIVGDLEINKKTNIKTSILKLKILATYLGLIRVAFHVSENSKLNAELAKFYNSKKGLAIGYLNLLNEEESLEDLNFTYSDFDTF